MANWTTGEIRRLKQAHADQRPKRADLAALFPRHSLPAISGMASKLGLRTPEKLKKTKKIRSDHHRWLRIAHLHFSNREIEMRGGINGRR